MTEPAPTPRQILGRAAADFDTAVNNPARRVEAIDDMFAGLAAGFEAIAAEGRRRKEARRQRLKELRNTPEARAARAAAARRGWETRRARMAAEEALQGLDDGPARTGPTCGEMNHNSIGSEVFCQLDPGHDEDHDDLNGTEWECEE